MLTLMSRQEFQRNAKSHRVRSSDKDLSDKWSHHLCGRRIVTGDINRVEEIRTKAAADPSYWESILRHTRHHFSNTRDVLKSDDSTRLEKTLDGVQSTCSSDCAPPPQIYLHKATHGSLNNYFMAQPMSPLLALPTEIRLMVLEESLKIEGTYLAYRKSKTSASWREFSGLSLLFVCKQLYIEALPIAYRTFTIKESELPSSARLHLFSSIQQENEIPALG